MLKSRFQDQWLLLQESSMFFSVENNWHSVLSKNYDFLEYHLKFIFKGSWKTVFADAFQGGVDR